MRLSSGVPIGQVNSVWQATLALGCAFATAVTAEYGAATGGELHVIPPIFLWLQGMRFRVSFVNCIYSPFALRGNLEEKIYDYLHSLRNEVSLAFFIFVIRLSTSGAYKVSFAVRSVVTKTLTFIHIKEFTFHRRWKHRQSKLQSMMVPVLCRLPSRFTVIFLTSVTPCADKLSIISFSLVSARFSQRITTFFEFIVR